MKKYMETSGRDFTPEEIELHNKNAEIRNNVVKRWYERKEEVKLLKLLVLNQLKQH